MSQVDGKWRFAGSRNPHQHDIGLVEVARFLSVILLDRKLDSFNSAKISLINTMQESRGLFRRTPHEVSNLHQERRQQIDADQA